MMRDTQGKYSQSGTLGYNGSKGNVSAGMSHSSGHNQYSAGMSGGITLYGGGLVLSPTLGNTVAIVETRVPPVSACPGQETRRRIISDTRW
jgi:outer membrane usher protein